MLHFFGVHVICLGAFLQEQIDAKLQFIMKTVAHSVSLESSVLLPPCLPADSVRRGKLAAKRVTVGCTG